jgi:hypothetical protein
MIIASQWADMKKYTTPELGMFAGKVFLVLAGLILLASIIAVLTQQNIGMIFFVLGLSLLTIGAYLGGPRRRDLMNPRIRNINIFHQPSPEELTARNLYFAKNSVPLFAFENVVALAGLIAVVIALIILFW